MEGRIVFELKAEASGEMAVKGRNTELFFLCVCVCAGFFFQGLPGEIGVSGKTGPPGPAVSFEGWFASPPCSP